MLLLLVDELLKMDEGLDEDDEDLLD